VVEEFGQDEFDGHMTKLLQLKQTGTVAEYRLAFEECMYHLISLDESLSNRWFVTQFVFGLREDIRLPVRLQSPTSITRAASLARIQEETDHHRPRTRPAAPTKHPPNAAVAVPATMPARVGNSVKSFLMMLLEEAPVTIACCQLSANAVAGTATGQTMRLQALLGNQVMILLIDSGSTHTFVTKPLLLELVAIFLLLL